MVDVVNTGDFLLKLLRLLREKFKIKVAGIFSYILDVSAKTSSFFQTPEHKELGSFNYFVEKKLDQVDNIRDIKQRERFNNIDAEAFLRFWHMADNICNIKRMLVTGGARVTERFGAAYNLKSYHCHKLELKDNASTLLSYDRHYFSYLSRLVKEHSTSLLVIRDDHTSHGFAKIMKDVNKDLELLIVKDYSENHASSVIKRHKSLIIFSAVINIGQSTKELVKYIKRHAQNELNILVITFCMRTNIINETKYLSSEYEREMAELGVRVEHYYKSDLPYYLTFADAEKSRQVENRLSDLWE
ncbi:MAG: hypothetical protein HZB33_07640 [Nitrospirae bacterium]|nr:hypothetical protein [Nitrospirota bacterium]